VAHDGALLTGLTHTSANGVQDVRADGGLRYGAAHHFQTTRPKQLNSGRTACEHLLLAPPEDPLSDMSHYPKEGRLLSLHLLKEMDKR